MLNEKRPNIILFQLELVISRPVTRVTETSCDAT